MDDKTRLLIRVAERKAAALGVATTEYLAGIISGEYPRVTPAEIEEAAADDEARRESDDD